MGETFQDLWLNLHRTETYFKLAIVIALAPLWVAFLRALYREADLDLSAQGGLLGRVPGAGEAQVREREAALRPHPLVNEPLATRTRATRSTGRAAGATRGPARQVRGGAFQRVRRRGF